MKRVRFDPLNRFLAPPRGRFFFCAFPQPSTQRTTAAAPAAAQMYCTSIAQSPTDHTSPQHAFAHMANSSSLGMRVARAMAAISAPEQRGRFLRRS